MYSLLSKISIFFLGARDSNFSSDMSDGSTATQQASATAKKVVDIIKTMIGPVLMVLGGAGTIYIIILGVQYAKAEDNNKRLEIKKRLINLGIGVICIFVLATLCLAIPWQKLATDLFGVVWEATPEA